MNFSKKESSYSMLLEKRLEQLIQKQEIVENNFRSKHVNYWTVMFCDVSQVLNQVHDLSDEASQSLLVEYRNICFGLIEQYDPPFISTIEGPQVLACFAEPQQACDAAIAIQTALKSWADQKGGRQYFVPSIGLHTGDFVVKDNDLKQSNACNLGKRIQTEAKAGEILASSVTCAELKLLKKYDLKYKRTAEFKNIPEPQKIYNVNWHAFSNSTKRDKFHSYKNNIVRSTKKEKIIKDFMGILVCDITGSSKKFWSLGDREGNMLIDMYRKEVFPLLIKYRACCIDIGEGDQITAIFPKDYIDNTALAAIQIQKSLFRRNSNTSQWYRHKLNVSIGIHCGNVFIKNDKVSYNETFYAAKKIQDEADENEIFVSGVMQQQLEHLPNIFMEMVSKTSLKGLEKDIAVYNLQWHKSGL